MFRYVTCFLLPFALSATALAQEFDFNTPSDDRWHYPFNFTPGTRTIGTCFGTGGLSGFNDRDGIVLIGWNTSSTIPSGQGAASYNIASITVTLRNTRDAAWPIDLSTDEWYTTDLNGDTVINGDGIPRGQPGDTDGESSDADPGRPVELFGMGFGPVFTETEWTETSFYVGSDSMGDFPRDPFPFVFRDGAADLLHVEDNLKGLHNAGLSPPFCTPDDIVCPFTPQSWSLGVPVGYTPGAQPTAFDVTFDINLDLSDGRVREYFQRQLDTGRVLVAITCLQEAVFMGGQSGFPAFFMKDSTDPEAVPARLTIVLSSCEPGDGDINCDGTVSGEDLSLFVGVLLGTETVEDYIERSDLNADDVRDGDDVQPFIDAYLGEA